VVKKKAAAEKTSDTKEKKRIARKVKTASGTIEKPATKKRKLVAGPTERTTARKAKMGTKKVKKVKAKEKQKTLKKKIVPKTQKKKRVKTEAKAEKKTTEAKVAAKRKTGKDATAHPRIRKAGEKVLPKSEERILPKMAGKVKVSKTPAPKTAKKVKARATTKAETVEKGEKTLGPIKKKVVAARMTEIVTGNVIGKREKKERLQRIAKGAGEAEEIRETAKAGQDEAVRGQELKEVAGGQQPGVQDKIGEGAARPPMARAVLPEEYGENAITLMPVDPHRLFAFWEVREETLKIFRGQADVRVYDVTGIDFDMMDANSCLDIRTDDRIGKCYVGVNPGREYIADVGIIFDGIFIAVARSAKVSTPRGTVSGEGVLSYDLEETGFRTGY
jgi:hypothetical protein